MIHQPSAQNMKYWMSITIGSLLETITVPANVERQSSERALNPSLVKNYAITCTTLHFVFPTNEHIGELVGFDWGNIFCRKNNTGFSSHMIKTMWVHCCQFFFSDKKGRNGKLHLRPDDMEGSLLPVGLICSSSFDLFFFYERGSQRILILYPPLHV